MLVPVRPRVCNVIVLSYVYFKVEDGAFSAGTVVLSKFGMLGLPLDLLLWVSDIS